MDLELPKRFFREGNEPQVEKINNSCKMSLLKTLQKVLPGEYAEVKSDPVFAQILAIHENCLGYSGRLIHSFMCKQLDTAKVHELWFVFARRPLRFSLQEFYAVTGLKCQGDEDCGFEQWKDDMGFWSKLLKRGGNISIKTIKDEHIKVVHKWTRVDRLRLVYLCVVAGLLMAKDEKVNISHTFIKLVMDLGKLRNYPWGLHAFDHLVKSIIKTREKLKQKKSYVLDGFSYAFQIWIMEAIPDFGVMLGRKLKEEDLLCPRCANWSGAAKVSYEEIIELENSFGSEGVLYPCISSTGNFDVIDSAKFAWDDEMTDERVDSVKAIIRAGNDWSHHIFESKAEVEEIEVETEIVGDVDDDTTPIAEDSSGSGPSRGKKKMPDHGAERRKHKLLCQRSSRKNIGDNEDMKSFIQGLFHASFTSLEEKIKKQIEDRFGKLETEVRSLKESVSLATSNSSMPSNVDHVEPDGKAENIDGIDCNVSLEDTHGPDFSKMMELGTQEFLRKTMDHISQPSQVDNFDPSQPSKAQKKVDCATPLTSFTDLEMSLVGKNDADYPLVFLSQEDWHKLQVWSMTPTNLQIGPSVFDFEFASRIIGPKEWLQNEEIDAVMYLFQENTSLRRWKPDRVAFMNCLFSVQIKTAYNQFLKDKKRFKCDSFLLSYGNGELPPHGRTRKVWDVDVDHIYVPVFVQGNHWISLCINFVQRTVEFFDCAGLKHNKDVEAFAVLIPRIVKAVQSPANKKHLNIGQNSIIYVPMQGGLNKSCCDCGVYALKFIECHLLGLDFSLMDDDNIREARHKIAFDLWEAANDSVLVDRMSKYETPKNVVSNVVDID